MGFKHFVAFIAALMGLNALALDVMLPALPHIGEALNIEDPNQRQWIITAYLLGFGAAQIAYGTLADRFGRKPVLMVGVGIYTVACFISVFAHSFEAMLAYRVLQGVGAAASRVLATSIVRDRFSGRQMARVMSLTFIVFLTVPIVAPTLGQLLLLVAPWPWIFVGLGVCGLIVMGWAAWRLPETLHPDDRVPLSLAGIGEAFRLVVSNRMTMAYMTASTVLSGALFGFVNSAQQVFYDALNAPQAFTVTFATIAAFMAVASLINAKIVVRVGTRIVSHTALAGMIVLSAAHAAVAVAGHESIWTFALFQAATMFCFGMVGSNFGAMAMEPMGHIAGTASSVQGFVTTIGGALVGLAIGQQFDGTTVPLSIGFLVAGLLAMGVVILAEGRLFRPRNAA
jgi:DHA1 family bicyclomycin/chloramphenicol resistance-like MFS transporter